MKRTLITGAAIALCLFLYGCGSPLAPEVSGGTGAIRIDFGSSPRNLFQYFPCSPSSYTATGAGPGGAAFETTWNAGSTCTVNNLVPGTWAIVVDAFESADGAGHPYRRGLASAKVVATAVQPVSVLLGVVPGTGSLSFQISLASGYAPDSAIVELYRAGAFERSLALTVEPGLASGAVGSLAAAEDWSAVVRLESGGSTRDLNATIHVTDGKTTVVAIDATSYGQSAPPPSGLTVSNGRFSADLSWSDADGEDSYIVERRAAGSVAYSILAELGSGVTSYRDRTASHAASYEYRVSSAALGSATTTPSGSVSITTDFSSFTTRRKLATGGDATFRVEDDGRVTRYGATLRATMGSFRTEDYRIAPEGLAVAGLSGIVSVRATDDMAVFLDEAGHVWTYESNATSDGVPLENLYAARIVDVAVGSEGNCQSDFVLALDADGGVWAWGDNSYGQLGDGTTKSRDAFAVQVILPSAAVSIAAGSRHSLAVLDDGTVYAWGRNSSYQLGLSGTSDRTSPVLLPALSGISRVFAGYEASYALSSTGSVYAWGDNSSRKLFIDTSGSNQQTPTLVTAFAGVADVQPGKYCALARTSGGEVWGAGQNYTGELGSMGAVGSVVLPAARLSGLPPADELVHGGGRAFARSGSAWYAWGDDDCGELGDRVMACAASVVSWTPPAPFVEMKAGMSHALARDSAGGVWAWGSNKYGQLGTGDTVDSGIPRRVTLPAGTMATAIVARYDSSYVVLDDGTLYRLGESSAAVAFPEAVHVESAALGSGFLVALDDTGHVWSWGSTGKFGVLGDGTTVARATPARVIAGTTGHGDGTAGDYLKDVSAIAAGGTHVIVMFTDGTLGAWGYNYNGQLGSTEVGTTTSTSFTSKPVVVTGFADATSVFASDVGSGAITSDGTLYGWGRVPFSTTTSYPKTPSPIARGGSYLTAGLEHGSFFALEKGGAIVFGGSALMGRRGDGLCGGPAACYAIPSPATAALVASGEQFSLAYGSEGIVYAWGANGFGQLGIGSVSPTCTTVPVTPLW